MDKGADFFPDFADTKKPDPDSPVYLSLMSMMKVDLVISPESDVWMLHDQPLPEVMKWVEYDQDLQTLTLVSLSGKVQDFGMRVPPAMQKYMKRATKIYAIHQGENEIKDMTVVPLLVRAGLN